MTPDLSPGGSLRLGYALSSEEHSPLDLVANARRAEETGFEFALISDHFHPWTAQQGNSSFVWSVIGAIAGATSTMRIGTGVTCSIMRIHPAIVAQAAATAAAMLPGRFFLGVGSGENLNEHIVGLRWPSASERLEMLDEAIAVIRLLWSGGVKSHTGKYFRVEDAELFTLPAALPPVLVAASAPAGATLAGKVGQGLISTAPDAELVAAFREAGGEGHPAYGMLTVCLADDQEQAVQVAHRWWPTAALPDPLGQELATPRHFEQAVAMVDEEKVAQAIVCGADVERHLDRIRAYAAAGFDHVYVHQVGPDQEALFRFYGEEILPRLSVAAGG